MEGPEKQFEEGLRGKNRAGFANNRHADAFFYAHEEINCGCFAMNP